MFFLYPILLLLLLLPLGLFIYSFQKNLDPLTAIFSKEMLEKLSLSSTGLSKGLKNRLFLLMISLLIIASARLVKPLDSLDTKVSKSSVIVCLDVSKSMHNNDVYPSRLSLAQEKVKDFINKATELNIGILLYANDVYMIYPLSQDSQTLLTLLDQGKLPTTFKPQSNLFAALEGSVELLKMHKNRHILLFSDGGKEISRVKELAYLKKHHIILSSLALHPNKTMKELVTQTQGTYQSYTWGDSDIQTIIKAIKKHKTISSLYHYEIPQYKEYFQLPLTCALLLLLLFYLPIKSKNSSLKVLLLFTFSGYYTPLDAGVFDFWHLHQANSAYKQKNYEQALKHYKKVDLTPQGYYNKATTLYKSKHYFEAILAYKKSFTPKQDKQREAKIYHNIATSYARMRKFRFAKKYYMKSLLLYHTTQSSENLQQMIAILKVQRKNLHKKYEKLHFKSIAENTVMPESALSNYNIQLNPLIPSEEEKWFKRIAKEKSPFYLQKLTTHQRSQDANLSY